MVNTLGAALDTRAPKLLKDTSIDISISPAVETKSKIPTAPIYAAQSTIVSGSCAIMCCSMGKTLNEKVYIMQVVQSKEPSSIPVGKS